MKWRCAWCGREYDAEDPPCDTCGHETFEPVSDGSQSPFESGSIAWVCTNCGREHVKHSPPCSRCGNHEFEKRTDEVPELDDISAPGYLDVGKPYLAGVVLVLGIVALVVTGVIPFPGFGGPPTPPEAPGDSDRSGELDLSTVETALFEQFQSERRSEGVSERELGGGGIGVYTDYITRHEVADRYDPEYDGSVPDVGAFDLQCESPPAVGVTTPDVDIGAFDDESALAAAIADELLSVTAFRDAVLEERTNEGITIHVAPDGTVFFGYSIC